MSVWHTTSFFPELSRELTVTVLLPDYRPEDDQPFETLLYFAPEGYGSDYITRFTTLEVQLCKQQRLAAVCLPPSLPSSFIRKTLLPWLSALYPIRTAGNFLSLPA